MRALEAGVEEHRADQGLAGVAEDGLLVPAAGLGLAGREPQGLGRAQPLGHQRADVAADQGVQAAGELALAGVGEAVQEVARHDQAEHPIAQKLQLLVVLDRLGPMPDARMRQGALQQRAAG